MNNWYSKGKAFSISYRYNNAMTNNHLENAIKKVNKDIVRTKELYSTYREREIKRELNEMSHTLYELKYEKLVRDKNNIII